jgi:hypothetical protein
VRRRGGRPGGRAAGLTLVEVVTASAVIALVVVGIVGGISASAKQAALAADTALAVDGARNQVEKMAARSFHTIFASFNDTGTDGSWFDIPGLTPVAGASHVGHVSFPGDNTANLYENVSSAALGMPRDLDGDGLIDGANKASTYVLLPFQITVSWRGSYGTASYTLNVLLTDRIAGS